ncbi:hypothetical protein B0A48_13604 [Cryoendolithus antarcticus]|uniref:Uncharacterized protein n=1 Tax=Cryoendolithus antarcticus TaxID=1507870 RepID=A0A1V8SP27_9PEZI|nr:hypothetical protein B0A48_13604 [Cryoendolithus antarcticus]
MSAAAPKNDADALAEAVIACDVTFVPKECFHEVDNASAANHGGRVRVLVGMQYIPGTSPGPWYDPPEAKRVYLSRSNHENSELPGSYKKRLYTGGDPCTCDKAYFMGVYNYQHVCIDNRIDWPDFECVHTNVDYPELMALPGLSGLDEGDRAEVVHRWLDCVYEHVMASDSDRKFRSRVSTLHYRAKAAFQARLAVRESFPGLPKSRDKSAGASAGSSATAPKIQTAIAHPGTVKPSGADRALPIANDAQKHSSQPSRTAYSLFDDSDEEDAELPELGTT